MKIFIELPTWLGDCIMATPSIENILVKFPNAKITIFGSKLATAVFQNHKAIEKIIIDDSRNAKFRILRLYKLTQNLTKFDYGFSFRSSIISSILLFFLSAKNKNIYHRAGETRHQVMRYNDFVNDFLNINLPPKKLKIHTKNNTSAKNILGVNPGATYGSAKRWYPEKFAEVINKVAHNFDEVVIFGGAGEVGIASDIEKDLTITNYKNLAGKLSVDELIKNIAKTTTFLTGDSGPMHIAASFDIKIIALFGATKDQETSPWCDDKVIIRQDLEKLDCVPCMQRTCPLKHHKCMKNIEINSVVKCI